VQLAKHHGLGNDFLVALDEVNGRALTVDGDLARDLCDRRRGVGADGLIHGARPPAGADVDVVMHLFNSDGTRAEMSGNGIRCLGQALARARRAEGEQVFQVATDAGLRRVTVAASPSGGSSRAGVVAAMGSATVGPSVPDDVSARLGRGATGASRMASVEVGNPHLVVEVREVGGIDLDEGRWADAQVPSGINVEFVAPSAEGVQMRVWERGAGVTEACGTGACAAAWAAHRWGWSTFVETARGATTTVHMPGGVAEVTLGAQDEIELGGEVVFVADIEVPDA
jgi:diaminopimelate epimerase